MVAARVQILVTDVPMCGADGQGNVEEETTETGLRR